MFIKIEDMHELIDWLVETSSVQILNPTILFYRMGYFISHLGMKTLTVAGVRQYNPPGLQLFWFDPPIFAPFQPTILSAPINTRTTVIKWE